MRMIAHGGNNSAQPFEVGTWEWTAENCVGDAFCFGNGSGCTPCPCGNESPAGSTTGCLHDYPVAFPAILETGAELSASGAAKVSDDTLRMRLTSGSASSFALLTSANNALPANGACPPGSGLASPLLDGLRCIGGGLIRHGTRATDNRGHTGVTNNTWGDGFGPPGGLILNGNFTAGQTRLFQVFYREDPNESCGTGQNTSNAVSITFEP